MTSTVYIAKNVYGGDGLGRLGDGRVVFVPGAWAGENVKAEIIEEKKHFVKARLVEVVEPSPDRLSPPSPPTHTPQPTTNNHQPTHNTSQPTTTNHQPTHNTSQPTTNNQQPTASPPSLPGMVYSTLSYAGELKTKGEQLGDFFERARIAIPEIERGDAPSASPFNYRNKVVYHFAKQGGQWVIGYRREPSHEIVDVTDDPLAVPEINAKLAEVRRGVLTLLTQGAEAVRRDIEKKGNVTIRWTKKTGVKWWVGEPPPGLVLKETTCGRDFEVPADGFYQVNPAVGEELVQAVVDAYRKGADAAPNVLDLYCGVGVFGLCCQPPKLIGIESGRQAIEFAKRNALSLPAPGAKNQAPGATPPYRFFAEEVGRNLRRIPIGPKTTVIVDPPRGGLEPGVARWLANSSAPRLFYVSCDPATLMRDLREITRAYDVESVRWFNMFPRTARFETLVVLRKK